MTSNQALENANHDQTQLKDRQSFPLWKKVLAGFIVVAFVFLLTIGTTWIDHMVVSKNAMLMGLALGLGYSIALVLVGILVATSLIWVIGRTLEIMNRSSTVIE